MFAVEVKGACLWIFNTGSTVHVCPDCSLFINYCKTTVKQVQGIRKTPATICGVGTVDLTLSNSTGTTHLRLTNVLYIPKSPLCLLSASRLEEVGGRVEFGAGEVVLYNTGGGVLGPAMHCNRLYALNVSLPMVHVARLPTWEDRHY